MPPRSNNKKKGRNNKGEKKTKVQKKIEKESNNPNVKEMYRQLKADGCRTEFTDDGKILILHPCMKPDADTRVFSDRSLINLEDRRVIVQHYIHNYEEDLRQGVYEGTSIIANNLACEHIGVILRDSLLEKDIHHDLLRFLNQSNKNLSTITKKGAVTPNYQMILMIFDW